MGRFLEGSTKPNTLNQSLVPSPESSPSRVGVRIAFALSVALAALFVLAAQASANFTDPAAGSKLQSPPTDFAGDADSDFFTYDSSILLRLERTGSSPGPVGTATGPLNPAGQFDVPASDFGPPLADGKYRVEAIQRDLSAPVDPDDLAHNRWFSNFWVDSLPPDTRIDSPVPAPSTNLPSLTFTFHAEDVNPQDSSGTSLECRVDAGLWQSCNLPASDPASPQRPGQFTATGMAEGSHTFEVRAIDGAGNVDPTPATSTWIVDQTDPTISISKPAMRERFVLDQNVDAIFSCDDPLAGGPPPVASGIKTCSAPNKVPTGQLGNFRYTVNAEDFAGNTFSFTHSYAVDPPRYADVINAGNPIAYYRMNEALGSDPMLDRSGNGNDGEYKNGIALKRPPAPSCHVRPHPPYTCDLTSDPQDFAAWFPARDGYGFTNNIAAPQNAYTLEAWIKRADHGDGSVVGHGGGGQLFVKDGRLALRQVQDTVQSSGPVLTPGQWFHVAATWNGSVTRLYVNGSQVASSNSANKPPSGISTFYVGYGDQAPWFHGSLDEAAYYGQALSGSAIRKRWVVGTAKDVPSPVGGPPIQRPEAHIDTPANGGLYAPTKVPDLDFYCSDLDGPATVASCTASVDGNPALDGSALPDTPGPHTVVVTAVDTDGLTRSHTHSYTVKTFAEIFNSDSPIAYYRLGDATGDPMKDSGPQGRDGIYKNDQESGPVGISGDGDHARRFFGAGGYGYVNDIAAPRFQSTLEAWVNPDDHRDQSVLGHGDAGEIYIEGGLFKFRHMGTTVSADVGPAPGRFTQIVAVWDGVTISLFVDGELRGQTEATKRPSSISTFYVGYGEIKPWFKGSIDEVAYYDRALTPGRVLEHFLADPPPEGDDPVSSEDPSAGGSSGGEPSGGPVGPPADPGSFKYQPGSSPVVAAPDKATKSKRAAARKAKVRKAKVRRAKVRKAKVRKCRALNGKKARRACLRRI